MKILFFVLCASSFAFGQKATSELPQSSKNLASSSNVVSYNDSRIQLSDDFVENQLTVTYEDKKLKKAEVFSADGKLVQTSSNIILNEKKLKEGEYLIKVEFQDGTSTSTKFIKD